MRASATAAARTARRWPAGTFSTRHVGNLAHVGNIARLGFAAIVVGVLAGATGVVFALLLHLVQHIAFGYHGDSFLAGVEQATAGRRIVALTGGGALVAIGWWLLRRHASSDISVAHALDGDRAALPLSRATIDGLLQIVAVGAGASLGREAAPRQVAAAAAARIADRLRLSESHRRVLIASGAGAGLAAVYNVPISGALFTLEVLLASAAVGDVVLAVITSVTATAVARGVLHDHAIFTVPPLHLSSAVICWALVAGPLAAVAGTVFIQLIAYTRRQALSGAWVLLGIPGTFLVVGFVALWHPELLGNGKGPTQIAFDNQGGWVLFLAVILLKPLLTALCLFGGARGGMLTPSLAVGAAFGVLAAEPWQHFWPGTSSGAYAIVGAAAVASITQRAPLMAGVIVIELTGAGLAIAVPVAVAVVTAHGGLLLLRHALRRLAPDAIGSDVDDDVGRKR